MIIDSYFYGKIVFAPLNIVLYNVFSGHGPEIYGEKILRVQFYPYMGTTYYFICIGTEPLSFYFKNMLLNMNIVFLLALLSVVAVSFRVSKCILE